MQGSGSVVEVDIQELSGVSMAWCGLFPYQHGTRAADGEGIRPETDIENG